MRHDLEASRSRHLSYAAQVKAVGAFGGESRFRSITAPGLTLWPTCTPSSLPGCHYGRRKKHESNHDSFSACVSLGGDSVDANNSQGSNVGKVHEAREMTPCRTTVDWQCTENARQRRTLPALRRQSPGSLGDNRAQNERTAPPPWFVPFPTGALVTGRDLSMLRGRRPRGRAREFVRGVPVSGNPAYPLQRFVRAVRAGIDTSVDYAALVNNRPENACGLLRCIARRTIE